MKREGVAKVKKIHLKGGHGRHYQMSLQTKQYLYLCSLGTTNVNLTLAQEEKSEDDQGW